MTNEDKQRKRLLKEWSLKRVNNGHRITTYEGRTSLYCPQKDDNIELQLHPAEEVCPLCEQSIP
jgi:hypothetical protein